MRLLGRELSDKFVLLVKKRITYPQPYFERLKKVWGHYFREIPKIRLRFIKEKDARNAMGPGIWEELEYLKLCLFQTKLPNLFCSTQTALLWKKKQLSKA